MSESIPDDRCYQPGCFARTFAGTILCRRHFYASIPTTPRGMNDCKLDAECVWTGPKGTWCPDHDFPPYIPKKRRDPKLARLQRLYGLDYQSFAELTESQGGVCAICQSPPTAKDKVLFVDHDHDTGDVRGLLCRTCNTGMGMLGDSAQGLTAALAYLSRYQAKRAG